MTWQLLKKKILQNIGNKLAKFTVKSQEGEDVFEYLNKHMSHGWEEGKNQR